MKKIILSIISREIHDYIAGSQPIQVILTKMSLLDFLDKSILWSRKINTILR
jgi:hypothetical protein